MLKILKPQDPVLEEFIFAVVCEAFAIRLCCEKMIQIFEMKKRPKKLLFFLTV
jgi:hypothetical protein